MTRIEPYPLWLGHAGDVRDFRRLFDLGIQAIVDLAINEPPGQPPRGLVYARFPLVDGGGNRGELLFLALSTTATLLKMKLPTLVQCSVGTSRSPSIAAGALALAHGRPPDECLEEISRQHTLDVTPVLWHEIKAVLQNALSRT